MVEILGAIAGAVAVWGAEKVYNYIANKISGGGQSQQAAQQARGGTKATQSGGVRSITMPSGATVEEYPTGPPEMQKYMEENMPAMIEEYMAKQEDYPDLNQLIQQRKEIFGDPQDEFGPIADQARKDFQEKTIPSLAERFTALTGGGQRSGEFNRQLTAAGGNLDASLAALKSSMGGQQRQEQMRQMELLQQNYSGRANQQQQRQNRIGDLIRGSYGTVATPAQEQGPGYGAQAMSVLGKAATTYGPDALKWAYKSYMGGGGEPSAYSPGELNMPKRIASPTRFGT